MTEFVKTIHTETMDLHVRYVVNAVSVYFSNILTNFAFPLLLQALVRRKRKHVSHQNRHVQKIQEGEESQ